MKFSAQRETLLGPLQAVAGVVERRQTMPILANFLLVAGSGRLAVTATDLEVELVADVELDVATDGEITVPGRKLLDICRALPEGATVSCSSDGQRMVIRSGKSRFTLSTLSADDFPTVDDIAAEQSITLEQSALKRLLDKTHFSMAHQDVRYYLNGLLLDVRGNQLKAVATDGHRLALCEAPMARSATADQQVIVPRKGVLELQRLLGSDGDVTIAIGTNHLRVSLVGIRFTSKLIDGRFPDYDRVIPKDSAGQVTADRESLRRALQRAAILSNEKYRGIRLAASSDVVTIQAHNPEQEEAEEQVDVTYAGPDVEIGFNVNYLLDALGGVDGDEVILGVTDGNSSSLVQQPGDESLKYVVMPMRL